MVESLPLEVFKKTCGCVTQEFGLVMNIVANGWTQQTQGSFPTLVILCFYEMYIQKTLQTSKVVIIGIILPVDIE